MTTGYVWHERYMWHDTRHGAAFLPAGGDVQPGTHAESPESKRRLHNLLDASGLLERLVRVKPRMATDEELLRFHAPEYVDRIRQLSAELGGEAGETTPFGPGSYDIARLAVGGCLAAVDAVLDGHVDNAYALVRPPGHHAESNRGRGFCIFANAALAAMHARAERRLERVAVLDWDVHHGNGTQQAFYADPSVLTISLHQDDAYPRGSGRVEERGSGAGEGYNVNVPLPPGSGTGAYLAALERVVVPALRAFGPQLIVVASGLDANALDPLARQLLHSEGYRAMTRTLLDVAATTCKGRLVLCHEGGYSEAYVPFCGLAIVEELCGATAGVADPFLPSFADCVHDELRPHQEEAIAAASASAALVRGR